MSRTQILLFVLIFSLCSCGRQSDQRSILVVGVEGLGFDVVSCGADPYDSNDLPGFATFCAESVRFTHAYTPSTLSQATWASLLTARYPYQHRVRHNGAQFLSAQYQTVSEQAVERGFATGYFSGGPPIFRKSGLAQGFEVFDDAFNVDRRQHYRPAGETFQHFLQWLDDDVGHEPFFAAVHLADLQFFGSANWAEGDRELRERSFASQLRVTGEALQKLIDQLKKRGLWDSTFVILTGLNGPGPIFKLLSPSTQISLFFKPPRKVGQQPVEWKVDRAVSLVDVGRTLYESLRAPAPERMDGDPVIDSLLATLQRPEVEGAEERSLITESAWPAWRGVGTIRGSVREDPYLFVYDRSPQIFNTFVDRLESVPFPLNDPRTREEVQFYTNILKPLGFNPYQEDVKFMKSLDQARTANSIEGLLQVGFWRRAARLAVQTRNWKALDRIGREHRFALLQLVARRNLSQEFELSLDGCGSLFLLSTANSKRICADRTFLSLYDWAHEKREAERSALFEKFLQSFSRDLVRSRVQDLNLMRFLPWDVGSNLDEEPSLTELYLAMPENRRIAAIVRSRTLKENGAFDLGPAFEF